MKKLFLFITLSIILSNLSYGQNVLFLKSGDKINGKFEGCKNDTIIFKFQGNKLKFKTSDIISIYFDEKLTTNEVNTEIKGSLSGVVTYFFNENYGDKPDIGAKVHIVDTTKIADFNLVAIDSFKTASFHKDLYLKYKIMGKKVKIPDNIIEKIKEFKLEDDLVFESLDKNAFLNLRKIDNSENVIKTVVDGNGNYSAKLNPGTYYVYIKSNNRFGPSINEIDGIIICEKIIVKNGEDINLNYNFENMIMLDKWE
jgi:hypothetical protein